VFEPPLGPDPDLPPSQVHYQQAYESGIARGKGAPFAMPGNQRECLHQAILTHARSNKTGKEFRGETLLEWIGDHAEGFAEWLTKKPDEVAFYSSFGPRGFLKWLNERQRTEEARRIG